MEPAHSKFMRAGARRSASMRRRNCGDPADRSMACASAIADVFENRSLGRTWWSRSTRSPADELRLRRRRGNHQPMGAVMQEGGRGRQWRCSPFDVSIRRRNFLYSLLPERRTPAVRRCRGRLRRVSQLFVDNSWRASRTCGQPARQRREGGWRPKQRAVYRPERASSLR